MVSNIEGRAFLGHPCVMLARNPRLGRLFGLLLGVGPVMACGGAAVPRIHVNQVGYLPNAEMVAIVEKGASTAEAWVLSDATGKTLAQGKTEPRGKDEESGETLQWLRFDVPSGSVGPLQIRIGLDASDPFLIKPDVYHQLKYDALAYFYYNRSGIDVAMPWAKDLKRTHRAGHLSDDQVPCLAHLCAQPKDVKGGWYDAGDYGKYVVNGGIALWTLLNLYEREKYVGSTLDDFGDGKLSIPEGENQVSDLLDEARWELEFLLKMQIAPGVEKSGMVYHKIHDNYWSPLGQAPAQHASTRFLHPPSTAATLNLVATAAQGARIWRDIDPEFAERCRLAAVRGWNAAQKFPKLFASPMSTNGGGPYDDSEVSDEFYWAAAELYITLREPRLLDYLRKSPHHGRFPFKVGHERSAQHTSMTWQVTHALGKLSLALVPNDLPKDEVDTIRKGIVAAADHYVELTKKRGYRVPMEAGNDHHYPWGSNSFVANNGLVLAVAADITHDPKYATGVQQAMDYLLGVNPIGFSYVSGYGVRSLQNPHHRFWAHAKGGRCPYPPPGALAGGPNSRLADPKSQRRLSGCAVERCYVDDADAWSVNEVAINWNAPLAWVAAWLDERGQGKTARPLFGTQAAEAAAAAPTSAAAAATAAASASAAAPDSAAAAVPVGEVLH
jgi:endoglucanase